MTLFKKMILWGIGSLLILLLALLLIVPTVIGSASLKQKIQTTFIQRKIGTIDYHKASFSVLPLPHLTIEKMRFSDQQRAAASVETVTVYPELRSLFRGQLRISKLFLGRPEFTAEFSDKPTQKNNSEKDAVFLDFINNLAEMMAPLATYTSELNVSIAQGYVDLTMSGQRKFYVKNFDLEAGLVITGAGFCDAKVNIVGPSMTMHHAGKKVIIDCDRLKAGLRVNKDKVVFYIDEVRLAHPALKLTGQFTASPEMSRYSLDLTGKDLDIREIRAAALKLGGDNETVKDIFAYLKGGRIPVIHLQSKSNFLSALGDLDNLIIRGQLENSDISIDDIGMQLAEVNGEALIANGILNASHARARLGETIGHDGSLEIGLEDDNDVFHLDIMLNTRLHQLPEVLKKIIDHEPFLHELSFVKNLKGRATARLLLGDSLEEINTNIEVSEIDLTADYQRISLPIEISGGTIIFSENMLRCSGLNGQVGHSTVDDTACHVDWGNGVSIDLSAGILDLDLGEFFPWLLSIDSFQDDLADLKRMKGNYELSALKVKSLHGIDNRSGQWQISAVGKVRQVSIDTAQFPETINLPSGEIRIVPGHFSFRDLDIQLMDSNFNLTGTVEGDIRQPDRAQIFLKSDLGEKTIHFLTQSGYIPSEYAVHAPVQFSETTILWKAPDDFIFKGNIYFPKGAQVVTDCTYQTDVLTVTQLDIKDQYSAAAIALDLQKDLIELVFNGKLQNKTLDQIFLSEQLSDSWVEGDLRVDLAKGKLSKSTIKGQLKGGNLIVPTGEKAPLIIETVSFSAKNNRIYIDQLSLAHQSNNVALTGQVDMATDTFILDLDASAGDLKWALPQKKLAESDEAPVAKSKIDFWAYPVSGNINFSAKSVSLGEYTWQPLLAKISKEQDSVCIDVLEANLCGIDTPGTIQVDGDTLDIEFQCFAKDEDFITTYKCLSKKHIEMSGIFELTGQIKSRGPAGELYRCAQGQFAFNAKDGTISKDKRLSRILEVVNFTEIVNGKIPDLKTQGFSYKTINVQGKLADKKMVFDKLFMDGKTLDLYGTGSFDFNQNTLDVKLLASPFQTVDSAIKSIPGVNYLLAGNLISIPVRISGNVDDPDVNIMSAKDMTSDFLNFADRIIKSPIKLIKNLNPYNKSKSK